MRKMAHVELVEEVLPAENSDNLDRIRVLGWWGVCKKNQYKVGDLVIMMELDSILPPIPYFSFKKTAQAIWDKDLKKKKLAERYGYSCYSLWEKDLTRMTDGEIFELLISIKEGDAKCRQKKLKPRLF